MRRRAAAVIAATQRIDIGRKSVAYAASDAIKLPHRFTRPPMTAQKEAPWLFRTYAGHSTATASNALYRTNLAKGQTGLSVAFDLPTQTGYDSDHDPGAGRGRQGRRAGRPSGRHAGAVRGYPAGPDEHLDDDQRHGALAAGAVHRRGRGTGRRRGRPARHRAERHHQGIPVARHLHLPAAALAADDHRRRGLHRQAPAEVEPDERLLLPPARGRGDAGAGTGLRARHRLRGAG